MIRQCGDALLSLTSVLVPLHTKSMPIGQFVCNLDRKNGDQAFAIADNAAAR